MITRKKRNTTDEAFFERFVLFVVSLAIKEIGLINDAELGAEGR